jgi:DNA-binding MarR family transcriptional regulator
MSAKPLASVELEKMPGHYIRRLHQIAVGLFMEETETFGLTPVQFAALSAVQRQSGIDQRTLARTIGFDTSTIGGVIDRLELRGLMRRNASPGDRRVRLLTVTPEGQDVLERIMPSMLKTQERILQPLPAAEQAEFVRLLKILVEANNDASRAPSEAD